jgi:hypothetical protein
MTSSAAALLLATAAAALAATPAHADSSRVRVEPDTTYSAHRGAWPNHLVITRVTDGEPVADVFTQAISPRLHLGDGGGLVACTNGIEIAWSWRTSGSVFEHVRTVVFSTILPDHATGRLDPRLVAEYDRPGAFRPPQNICSDRWETPFTPKYAACEVERGRPLSVSPGLTPLHSIPARRGSRAVKGTRL